MRKGRSVILAGALAIGAVTLSAGPVRAEETAANCVAGLTVSHLPGDSGCSATWTMGNVWSATASAAQGQAPPAPPPGRSQEAPSARPYGGNAWGLKVGPIFSSFREAKHEFKSNSGFEGGFFYGGGRRDMWSVVAEVMYATKAQKEDGQAKIDLHYLEVPILVRFNANPGDPDGTGVFLVGGEVFDILLKGKQNGVDVKDNYAGVDFGLLLGAGVEAKRFSVEGRFIWGLKEILKAGITRATTGGVKSKSFGVLLGYRFN